MNKKNNIKPMAQKGSKLFKHLPFILLVITVLILLGAWLIPQIKWSEPILDEPKISQAIIDFANTQMHKEQFELPPEADDWRVDKVLVNKLVDLPGPQGNRRATTTVIGSYVLPDSYDTADRISIELKKIDFKISRKYPEGISVQIDSLD